MANTDVMDIMSSTTAAVTSMEEEHGMEEDSSLQILDVLYLRILFIFFYSAIFFFGVSGNCLVVYVVLRNKSMQSITNIFITNLALSDILMCLLAVPFTPLSAFMKKWVFGEVMCHILPMTLGVSVFVSTLTSTAIAVDRYFVIVHPFKPRMKTCVCILLIIAIWIISISISLPLGIYQKVISEDEDGTRICSEHWPHTTARQFFTVTSLMLQYIVPCAIISYCYIKVWMVLADRSKLTIGTGCRSRDREEIEIRRKRRTNKMLVAMISIFVVCWLPLNAVHISSDYNKSFPQWHYFYLIFFFAHVIAMSSTIYNPFLYAWMNENFRNEFKTVLPAFMFRRSEHCYKSSGGDTTQYTTVDTINQETRKEIKTECMTAVEADETEQLNGKSATDVREGQNGEKSPITVNTNGRANEQIELKTLRLARVESD